MIKKSLKKFFELDAATGILLAFTTVFALLIVNSNLTNIYQDFFSINFSINLDSIGFSKNLTIRDLINDGLMALFFLLVGLELKKEILIGEISTLKKISLPLIAALGGIIFPALIFYYFNSDNAENLRGFAIPTATDIAFAYGVISLFGKKISHSLKVFLVALAVIDDLVAVLIIAIFYSQDLNLSYLIVASLILISLMILNIAKVSKILPYLVLGFFLWLMILKSGIHASLAGVLLSLFIPLQINNKKILESFAHKIAPLVNFIILPLFAFANAGVVIKDFSLDIIFTSLVLGVATGLFLGKQFGVMLFSFLAVKFKVSSLPRGTSWVEFYIAAIFTGIGFTMSLFIGSLAFLGDEILFDEVKIGVLLGSFLSIIYGLGVGWFVTRK